MITSSRSSRSNVKHACAALFAVLLAAAPLQAQSAFVGPYDVSNWTTTVIRDGGSSVNTSGAPASIQFLGGTLNCPFFFSVSCKIDFTIAAVATGNVLFDWNLNNGSQTSIEDWRFLLNGVDIPLSNATGPFFDPTGFPTTQSGSESFAVVAGDVFGFRFDCFDCTGGAIVPPDVTVSNFNGSGGTVVGPGPTPVPEPASLALLGIGLAGLAAARRRKTS